MSIDDRYDELANQATRDFPESWIPEQPHDMLIGEFVRLDKGTTAYGEYTIVILRTKDGKERGIWLMHHVLRAEFKRVRPKPGELVAVRFLGTKTSAAGHPYSAYRVVVQRDESAPDWDTIAAEEPGVDEW